ncbi:MAG: 50S ribosomal protein L24 [Alphaproteobacteria bacterium]|uniref:Large ribosomal subunit protein uL24 n=1 Tax=PS1 clade bacterium TaxID=2175152 RepID=A0A368DNU8_9PROT|nr:50S ribosomal protein L24 [Rhodobiaceae bacterium]OUT74298.1 MAG: 50S ribosomal protein L24 [Rhizobiales bacterium TMED25]RCL73509.1 MAG: 50S ribosomal protein L24 [PS1 clade bacterium]|tara:strand:+ start:604 stop:924 length:321 start_codon:yes stop_codon:yes gene_type:complete
MAAKIKKGDNVIVLVGKDKGKTGTVLTVFPTENKLVVQGVSIKKKHQKQTQTSEGGIIEKEGKIHASNVAIIDPKDSKASKVGFKFLKDGVKVRYLKKSEEILDDK